MSVLEDIHNDLEQGAARLVAEYRERLVKDALALCGNAAEAEDLAFRTFDRVIRKIDTFRGDCSLYGWMKTILDNLYRSSRRPKSATEMPLAAPNEELPESEENPTFEERLLNASDAEIVRMAIDRLSPSLKESIILHYFMEQPVMKIAKLLAVPEGTVKFRLHYARKVLAGILAEKLKRPLVLVLVVGLLLAATAAVGIWAAGGGDGATSSLQGTKQPGAVGDIDEVSATDVPELDVNASDSDGEPYDGVVLTSGLQKEKTTMNTTMMRKMKFTAIVATAAILSGAVNASASENTVLWWRFDGTGRYVPDYAGHAQTQGKFCSLDGYGGLSHCGADESKYATRGIAFPGNARVIDPLTDTLAEGPAYSATWAGETTNSLVLLHGVSKDSAINNAPIVNLKAMTVEAFFRVPSSALPRPSGGPAVMPVVNIGNDGNGTIGWTLGLYWKNDKLTPFFRGYKRGADGSSSGQTNPDMTYLAGVAPDKWHHLAFTVTAAGAYNFFVDYVSVKSGTFSSYAGWYFGANDGANNAFPLTVGANLYVASRHFVGDIAEIRISDIALTRLQFLRPVPAGPVDADTLICLTDHADWFGQTAEDYQSPYRLVLNSAFTTVLSPRWTYNPSVTETWPSVSDSTASSSVRGGLTATNAYEKSGSIHMATRVANSGGTAWMQDCLYIPDPDKDEAPYAASCTIPQDDFTFETYFRTDGTLPNTADKDTYDILQGTWCKICIYRGNGKLKTRLYRGSASGANVTPNYADLDSPARVDNAQWHHYALVYRKNLCGEVWLDHRKIGEIATPNGLPTLSSSSRYLNYGAEHSNSQGFQGELDGMRLTRRALNPDEFLRATTAEVATNPDVLLESQFDADWSALPSALDTEAMPVLKTGGSGSVPTRVSGRNGTYVMDGLAGVSLCTNVCEASLNGGSLVWTNAVTLQRRELTVEMFAKFTAFSGAANMMRLSQSADGGAEVTWALYQSGTTNTLRCSVNYTTNGVASGAARTSTAGRVVDPLLFHNKGVLTDGEWHHWALTFGVKNGDTTVVTLYRDYEETGTAEIPGLIFFNKAGTAFVVDGGTSGLIEGRVDAVRVTAGVLDSDDFMRFEPTKGLTVIFR